MEDGAGARYGVRGALRFQALVSTGPSTAFMALPMVLDPCLARGAGGHRPPSPLPPFSSLASPRAPGNAQLLGWGGVMLFPRTSACCQGAQSLVQVGTGSAWGADGKLAVVLLAGPPQTGGGSTSGDGEPGVSQAEDRRFSVVDMAALGGVLGALLLLALIALLILVHKHYGQRLKCCSGKDLVRP